MSIEEIQLAKMALGAVVVCFVFWCICK